MNLRFDEKCFTIKEVSKLLNISVPTVRRLVEQGKIKGINVCSGTRNIWRITEQALKDYLGKDD